jgi:hypothetical protein
MNVFIGECLLFSKVIVAFKCVAPTVAALNETADVGKVVLKEILNALEACLRLACADSGESRLHSTTRSES